MTKEKLQFFVQGNRHVFLPPSCLNHHVTTSLGFSLLREKQGRRPNRPTKLLHAYLALASHAGVFRGARISSLPRGGKETELP